MSLEKCDPKCEYQVVCMGMSVSGTATGQIFKKSYNFLITLSINLSFNAQSHANAMKQTELDYLHFIKT